MRNFVFALLVVIMLLVGSVAFAGDTVVNGGGPSGMWDMFSWGGIGPRVDFDSVSYGTYTALCTVDGQVGMLMPDAFGGGWTQVQMLKMKCQAPIWDESGVLGYDAQGRLQKWVDGRATTLYPRAFINPVRPAICENGLMAFGGNNYLVIAHRTGDLRPKEIEVGKFDLKSIAVTPGAIYFTMGDRRLYVVANSSAGFTFRLVKEVKDAEQVMYFPAAGQLFITEKWGVSSWVRQDGELKRQSMVLTGSGPFNLCGGNGYKSLIVTPGIDLLEIKPADGRG